MAPEFRTRVIRELIDSPLSAIADLKRDGGIFLEEVSRAEALELIGQLGTIYQHRDADEAGIAWVQTSQHEDVEGYAGFTEESLFPHTDRSVEPSPPNLVLFWVEEPAAVGGMTTLCDGREVYRRMAVHRPRALDILKRHGGAVFQSGGQFLASSLFEELDADRVRVRFRRDRLMHVPLECVEAVQLFVAYVEALTTTTRLSRRAAYLIDNTRWLHGRTSLAGGRRGARLLARAHQLSPGFSLSAADRPEQPAMTLATEAAVS